MKFEFNHCVADACSDQDFIPLTTARYAVNGTTRNVQMLIIPQSHRRVQRAMRKLVDEHIFEDAQARELDGKRVSQSVLDKLA